MSVNETVFLDIVRTVAKSPERIRPSDLSLLFDEADDLGVLDEFKAWLAGQLLNAGTQKRLCLYVGDE